MSITNGTDILKIGRKGRRKVQIGDGPVIEIDIVSTLNAWNEIYDGFRDEKGQIPKDIAKQINISCWEFVYNLQFELGKVNLTLEQQHKLSQNLKNCFSMAEALEFIKIITEEGIKLKSFFEIKSSTEPSLAAPTELIYSQ